MSRAVSLVLLVASIAAAPALSAPPPVVDNPAAPPEGTVTVTLTPRWHAGGEQDEDVLLGVPAAAVRDAAGDVYVTDLQLATVHVFGPDGTFLRDIGREGQGPGELRWPGDIVLMPDGCVGVALRFPGRIVLLHPDGTPAGSLQPGGDATAGGFSSLDLVRQRAGRLLVRGAHMTRGNGTFRRETYVALLDSLGHEQTRLFTHAQINDMSHPRFVEKDRYRPPVALEPDGAVVLAPQRDRYLVRIYAPDGTLRRTVTRAFTPRRRTAAQKAQVGQHAMFRRNGRRLQFAREICDTDPAIAGLYVDGDDELWVLSSRGDHDQPPGVLQTWDVFDPRGRLRRRVALRGPGDLRQDRLVRLDDHTWLLMRGARDALQTMRGDGQEQADDETAPLELVLLTAGKGATP